MKTARDYLHEEMRSLGVRVEEPNTIFDATPQHYLHHLVQAYEFSLVREGLQNQQRLKIMGMEMRGNALTVINQPKDGGGHLKSDQAVESD